VTAARIVAYRDAHSFISDYPVQPPAFPMLIAHQ
jgi:hypothetical protein